MTLTDGLAATKFNINPTGMVIPGPEVQALLPRADRRQRHHHDRRDLRRALLQLERVLPGQMISNGTLPKGVTPTG